MDYYYNNKVNGNSYVTNIYIHMNNKYTILYA